ncbi:MAG: acyclic terpene utilization AtuA family protein [Microthrixaceae bacterium]
MTVRIGGAQGFYGDGHLPVAALVADGVDYLVCEALAELTLAILQKDRQRDESLGYTRDLPLYVAAAIEPIMAGRTKLITNAGGINPIGAARAVVDALRSFGLGGVKVATVVGDDVRPHGELLGLPDDAVFANAYLGAGPIVEALDRGADIVVCGRVADASLFLAPLVAEFGWADDDWDRLACGVVGGHLLECSGQVSGGNYSGDWWNELDLEGSLVGFPIGEFEPGGEFVLTKAAGTGGRISFDTVREQLLYEVHDPGAYLNPDVTVDMTTVRLDDLGGDRVRVTGATGAPAPTTYKALVCRPAGYSCELRAAYGWPDAEAKARAAVRFLRNRAESLGIAVQEWCEEYFGAGAFGGPTVPRPPDGWEPPEVVARLAWRCDTREEAGRLGREAGLLGLSGPPMIATPGRARDGRPTQLFTLEALAVPRPLVDEQVVVELIDL